MSWVAQVLGAKMIFIGLTVVFLAAAAWSYWASGAIEDKRAKLKNHRGLTREQSAARKTMTVVTKKASYVLVCLAIFTAWLHFGLGL